MTTPITYLSELDSYIFECPHCNSMIMVNKNDINCRIFRHGEFKLDGKQLPPHSSKDYCDMVVEKGLIYGCGKPFQMIDNENAQKCDYI